MKLTVYFEGQFWVGVVEDNENGKLRAYRHVFGDEPKDGEIWDYVLKHLNSCMDALSCPPAANAVSFAPKRVSPKRLARLAAAEMQRRGITTAAQEALKLELEQRKKEHRTLTKEQREADKARKRELARQKAKDKHRGR